MKGEAQNSGAGGSGTTSGGSSPTTSRPSSSGMGLPQAPNAYARMDRPGSRVKRSSRSSRTISRRLRTYSMASGVAWRFRIMKAFFEAQVISTRGRALAGSWFVCSWGMC